MSKNKVKITRTRTIENNEDFSVKAIIIILVTFIALSVGMYYLTDYIIMKNNSDNKSTSKELEFDYSKILFGDLLNRSYSEYYAIALDYNKDYETYKKLADEHSMGVTSVKIYFLDVNDILNKNYIAEETNTKATTLGEVKVSGLTLFHIKKGKIEKIVTATTDIKKMLEADLPSSK